MWDRIEASKKTYLIILASDFKAMEVCYRSERKGKCDLPVGIAVQTLILFSSDSVSEKYKINGV